MNRYFTWALGQRLAGVKAVSCHPGYTGSSLVGKATGLTEGIGVSEAVRKGKKRKIILKKQKQKQKQNYKKKKKKLRILLVIIYRICRFVVYIFLGPTGTWLLPSHVCVCFATLTRGAPTFAIQLHAKYHGTYCKVASHYEFMNKVNSGL